MFSKEQIKELQHKLGLLGMKDTAFPVANNLSGKDTFTIVQNAINKKVSIKDLAEVIPALNTDIVTLEALESLQTSSIPTVVLTNGNANSTTAHILSGDLDAVVNAIKTKQPCLAYFIGAGNNYGTNGSIVQFTTTQYLTPFDMVHLSYHAEQMNGRHVDVTVICKYEEGHYVPSNININLHTYQEALVSGSNIKTINGESILGRGNIKIEGGSSSSTPDGTSLINIANMQYNDLEELGVSKCVIAQYNGHTYYSYIREEDSSTIGIYGFNIQYIDGENYNMNYLKAIYKEGSNYPDIVVGTNNIDKPVFTIKYSDYNYYNDLLEYEGLITVLYKGKYYSCTTLRETNKLDIYGSYIENIDGVYTINTIEIHYTPNGVTGPTINSVSLNFDKESDFYFLDPNTYSYTEFGELRDAINYGKMVYIVDNNTKIVHANAFQVTDGYIILKASMISDNMVSTSNYDGIGIVTVTYTLYSYSKAVNTTTQMFVLKTTGDGTKFLSDTGEYKTVALPNKATQTSDGLMSKEDKIKLDTYTQTITTMRVTQAEYSSLESSGSLDGNIIYYIVG